MPLPLLTRPDRRRLFAVGLLNVVLWGVVGIAFGSAVLERSLADGWVSAGARLLLVVGGVTGGVLAWSSVQRRQEVPSVEEPDDPLPDESSFEELAFAPLRLVTEDVAEDSAEDDAPAFGWNRYDDVDGVRVSGHGRLTFAAGERIVSMHVPFVPPFDVLPDFEFELEAAGGASVSGKVTQLRSYGVRLEVRRSGSLEQSDECRVDWFASRPADDVRAA